MSADESRQTDSAATRVWPSSRGLKKLAIAAIVILFPVLYIISWCVNPHEKLDANITALFRQSAGAWLAGVTLFLVGILMTTVEWRNHVSPWRIGRVVLSISFSVFAFLVAGWLPDSVVHMGLVGALYSCLVVLGLIWTTTLPLKNLWRAVLLLSCLGLAVSFATNHQVLGWPGAFLLLEFLPLLFVIIIWLLRPEDQQKMERSK